MSGSEGASAQQCAGATRLGLCRIRDNSEANFKTLKYCLAFPERFISLQVAQRFCDVFFTYYNTVHRHSGIGLHTAATVHSGTAHQMRAERAKVLTAANPGRFRRPPTPPQLPATAWINAPPKENINTELTALTASGNPDPAPGGLTPHHTSSGTANSRPLVGTLVDRLWSMNVRCLPVRTDPLFTKDERRIVNEILQGD